MQMYKSMTSFFIIIMLVLVIPATSGQQAIAAAASSHSFIISTSEPAPDPPIQLLEQLEWSSIPTIFTEQESRQNNNMIQIFDVEKGRVILSVANRNSFQKEAAKWLSDITSLAPEVQPDMKAKYIARVPLQPAQQVNAGNVQLLASVVFLFYYQDPNMEPLLLIFDSNNRPYFFHIHEDVKPFFEQLGLPH